MDEKTREFLDELFAFKIGDLVYFKTAAGFVIGRDQPHMHQITERRLQQCPGGLQMHYVVSGKVVLEIELTDKLPLGRKLTDEEAEGVQDYRDRTSPWSSNVPSWLPETAPKDDETAPKDDG